MKHYAIRRIYLRFETTSEEIQAGAFDETMTAFDLELQTLIEKHGLRCECQDTRFVNATKMSVCECAGCGRLMVNRDKNPAGFDGLHYWLDTTMEIGSPIENGGSHESSDLCIECLPVSHRWGLFS